VDETTLEANIAILSSFLVNEITWLKFNG